MSWIQDSLDNQGIKMTNSWVPEDQDVQRKVYLHPGQMHFGDDPTAITTILGSCVAVFLWNSTLQHGGVIHYILPGDDVSPESSLRYGSQAVRVLLGEALRRGRRGDLIAKVFGGSCMFKTMEHGPQLGFRNIQMARDVLRSAGVRIAGEHVGGDRGRKVIFHSDNGEAWVKVL
jgi:chemotaxis protein CheD